MHYYKILEESGIELNQHHFARYKKFIDSKIGKNEKGHYHHILPKSLFPEYKTGHSWNLVCLTEREHFIAHWILYKALPSSPEMQNAFWFMRNTVDGKITSKVYAILINKIRKLSGKRMSKNMKGSLTVLDSDGKFKKVSKDEYKNNKHLYKVPNAGKSVYKNVDGTNILLDNSDPIIASLGLQSIYKGMSPSENTLKATRGMIAVRHKETGETKHVKMGEIPDGYEHINARKVRVKGPNGECIVISKEEFDLGGYEMFNKGKVDVILSDGTKTKIPKDDERLVTGEAILYTSDKTREACKKNMLAYNESCRGKVWMTAPDGKEKQYHKDELQNLLSLGYIKGRKSQRTKKK